MLKLKQRTGRRGIDDDLSSPSDVSSFLGLQLSHFPFLIVPV